MANNKKRIPHKLAKSSAANLTKCKLLSRAPDNLGNL